MERLKASNQDKIRNEGRTQVELAAETGVAPIGFMRNAVGRTATRRKTGRKRKRRPCSETGSQPQLKKACSWKDKKIWGCLRRDCDGDHSHE
jgi:hypothetical protein